MPKQVKHISMEMLYHEYVTNKKTISQIALEQNVGKWKISDLLMKYAIPKRSKSESQRLALEKGSAPHPTKGKKLSKEHRNKIGNTMSDTWKEDLERAKKMSERVKQVWKERAPSEKERMMEALKKSARATAQDGSRSETFFVDNLIKSGWAVEQHKKDLVFNHEMHTDIYVPDARTVIEIDGPSHVEAIYGQERFLKTIAADNSKNGLLLSNGYSIIRLRERKSTKSNVHRRRALVKVLQILERNKTCDLDVVDRLVFIEIGK